MNLKNKIVLYSELIVLFLFLSQSSMIGQTVLFMEDFEMEAEGATSGTSTEGIAWSASCVGCTATGDYYEIDNGEFEGQDTNGPAEWITATIAVPAGTQFITVEMDFASVGYAGTGNLESSDECGTCSGLPADALSGDCNVCWDYVFYEVVPDVGSATNGILLGAPGTADNGTICQPIEVTGVSSITVEIEMSMWAGSERLSFDNLTVSAYSVAEATAAGVNATSCGGACSITDAGETNVICNDNGTVITSDDFVSVSLNPTVALPGASNMYSVSVTGGGASSIAPLVGTYSADTPFALNAGSAGGGNFDISIEDVDEAGCDFTLTVTDPGVCSTPIVTLPNCPAGCTNIIVQSFEGTAGEWNYTASVDCDAPDDMFTVVSSAGNITPLTGNNFFAYEDVESAGCAATKDQTLTFDPVAVPGGITNIKLCLSQFTDVIGGSELSDGAEFEVLINGVGQGVVNNEACAADAWFQSCVEYSVVGGDMISLVVTLGSNATGEFGGLDDILLCESAAPVACVTTGVIFSEIQTDPGSGDATGAEWIELQNITGAAIDMSGWYLTNGEFTVRIPDGTSLVAGAYYTIGSDGNNNTNQVSSGSPFNVDLAANGGYNFDLNIDVVGSCLESSTAMYCGSSDEISAFGFIDNNGEEFFLFNSCDLTNPVHAIVNGGGENNVGADDSVTCGDVCSGGVTINLPGIGGSAPAGYYDVEFDLNDNGCTTSYAWNGTEYVLDDTPTPGQANDAIAYTINLSYMESDGAGGMQTASFSYDIGSLERLSDEEAAISAAITLAGGINACEGQDISFTFSHSGTDFQTLAPNEEVQQGGSIGNIPTGWGSGVIFTGDVLPTSISNATGTGGGTYSATALAAGSYSLDVRIREIGYAASNINLTANDCQGYNDSPQDPAMSLDCIIDFQLPITVADCNPFVCPSITAVLSGDNSICNAGSADLTVTIVGGTGNYLVTLSDGTVMSMSGTGTISVSPTATTTYSIVSVTDANSCAATTSGSATITFNNTDCGTFPWNGNN